MDTGLSHFQPMVAILCGHGKYQNQYLDENKKWISDPDPKALCTKDKLEILEYCRKVSTVVTHIFTSSYAVSAALTFTVSWDFQFSPDSPVKISRNLGIPEKM